MYILDTDHLSVLDRGGINAQRLLTRLAKVNPNQVSASIISYEEQTRGWLTEILHHSRKGVAERAEM